MRSQLLRRLLIANLLPMLVVALGVVLGRESNWFTPLLGTSGLVVAAVAAGLVIAAVLYSRWVIGPLRSIREGVDSLSRGDFDHRVRIDSFGEIGELADALNHAQRDLSRQVQRTEAARRGAVETNELLLTALESMVEGVVVVDRNLKLLFFNEAARQLLNFNSVDAVTGRSIWELVRNSRVQELARKVLQQQEVESLEFEFGRTRRTLQLVASPLPRVPSGGCVLVFHDVTDLRRLENMRRDFVSNVSHELKTPLTAIQAYTETLLEGAMYDEANSRRFLEHISQQADRLLAQIVDLLTLSRIESGDVSVELTSVPIRQAVDECIGELQAVAESRQIQLVVEPPGEARLSVLANPHELRTILDNLVDNAIKYTPGQGTVCVRWESVDNSVLIQIQDTGIGIADEHLDRVFERFYRADRARSRDRGGTGLGLAIVKHLVQRFGGEITVSSELGAGSCFEVRLPAASS